MRIFAATTFSTLSKIVSILLFLGFIACSVFAVSSFRAERSGARLFSEYFSAAPVQGYGVQRSLAVDQVDVDASILRQAYAHHKAENYDLALVSFRAYLESNPVPENDEVLMLAGTSAVAMGNYGEGAEYFDQIEATGEFAAEAWWHLALINLQGDNLTDARSEWRKVSANKQGARFPAIELLEKISAR